MIWIWRITIFNRSRKEGSKDHEKTYQFFNIHFEKKQTLRSFKKLKPKLKDTETEKLYNIILLEQ